MKGLPNEVTTRRLLAWPVNDASHDPRIVNGSGLEQIDVRDDNLAGIRKFAINTKLRHRKEVYDIERQGICKVSFKVTWQYYLRFVFEAMCGNADVERRQ